MSSSILEALEITAARDPDRALEALLQALRRLAAGTSLAELAASEPDQDIEVLSTRFTAALARILTDPRIRFDGTAALRYAAIGRIADNLHATSGFGNSDHILRGLGARDTEGLRRLARDDREGLAKALLAMSMDTKLPIDMAALLEAPAPLALLAAVNLIAQKPITSLSGYERREELLRLAVKLRPAALPLNADLLVLFSAAWMLCSYAEGRDKHQIKRVLNHTLRDWAMRSGMRDASLPSARAKPDRPTLLVAAEIMHSNHVQYRYFGQYLRQLRQRFRLVLVTEESQADAHVRPHFDDVRVFKRGHGTEYLKDLAEQITAIAPDMIFWLSVGMRHWGPVLANLRLAPIQFAGLGHSASTFCDTIDYYVTEQGYIGDAALLSEQLVLLPDDSLVFERSPHYQPLAPMIRQEATPLRIVLPSNLLKLNPRFMAVLRRIRQAARRPLEFRVFPNVSGLELLATERVFQRVLPDSIVYPVMAYNVYLQRLNECDLNLSPFPFGGLHSVVDSLRQGIPVVALEGLEPHARTDAMLLRRLGMPEWLITQNEEAYIAAALRLIENDSERLALSHQAAGLGIDSLVYGDATTPLRQEVVESIWWIYQHHEAIKASGRKVFYPADRADFPARSA